MIKEKSKRSKEVEKKELPFVQSDSQLGCHVCCVFFQPLFLSVRPPFMGQSLLPVQKPDNDDVCRGQNLSLYPPPSQQFLQYSCSGYSALPVMPHNKWPGKPGPDSQALTGRRVVEFRASPRPGSTPFFSVVCILLPTVDSFLTFRMMCGSGCPFQSYWGSCVVLV